MRRSKISFVVLIILQAGLMSACIGRSSSRATQTPGLPALGSCGEQVYSREAEAGILENYFEDLDLYDVESGERIAQDQSEAFLLRSAQYLGIAYRSAFPNHLRLCIQEYNEAGKVVFDGTTNTDGQGSWALQPLAAGQYVMRVIVKNMVIASYVLKVSE